MKQTMTRLGLVAVGAAAFLSVSATPAWAHTSAVSHHETCNDSGATTTVVTFDNDYNLAATVDYRWGAETPGTAHMAAKTGASNTTVSLPSHDVGTIAWHVTWSDNYRQPAEGNSSLTILALADCHPATTTTTTGPATTTTTTGQATTTTLAQPTTTTTLAQATTTTPTAPATTTTTAEAVIAPTTTTTPPSAVLGTTETLPKTGGPTAPLVTIAAFALALGLAALSIARTEQRCKQS